MKLTETQVQDRPVAILPTNLVYQTSFQEQLGDIYEEKTKTSSFILTAYHSLLLCAVFYKEPIKSKGIALMICYSIFMTQFYFLKTKLKELSYNQKRDRKL